jgi:hypothetical protein
MRRCTRRIPTTASFINEKRRKRFLTASKRPRQRAKLKWRASSGNNYKCEGLGGASREEKKRRRLTRGLLGHAMPPTRKELNAVCKRPKIYILSV